MFDSLPIVEYQSWAKQDFTFESVDGMTGLYQCYCMKEGIVSTIKGENALCAQYYALLGGGSSLPRVLGMIIGIINNITFAIIKGLSNLIGFRDRVI